ARRIDKTKEGRSKQGGLFTWIVSWVYKLAFTGNNPLIGLDYASQYQPNDIFAFKTARAQFGITHQPIGADSADCRSGFRQSAQVGTEATTQQLPQCGRAKVMRAVNGGFGHKSVSLRFD
ncbi:MULTISPECIES: hypothetical protein, partial [unclassified Ruegeria]|uniref:hypothetical protein n=1 Tax=unclassified Ruegeria TaxID=2625375 RepID=UPI001C2CAAE1